MEEVLVGAVGAMGFGSVALGEVGVDECTLGGFAQRFGAGSGVAVDRVGVRAGTAR